MALKRILKETCRALKGTLNGFYTRLLYGVLSGCNMRALIIRVWVLGGCRYYNYFKEPGRIVWAFVSASL